MKTLPLFYPLLLFVLVSSVGAQEMVCEGDFCSVNPRLDPAQLLAQYPNALTFDNNNNSSNTTDDDTDPFNQIMCPMMRLLRRNNMLSESRWDPHYSIPSIVRALTTNLGLSVPGRAAMLGLTKGISAGQVATRSSLPGFVNMHQLHRAVGVSHASGYTFERNSTHVSTEALAATMTSLRALEDENGHLTFENLQFVKLEIAQQRGVRISIPSGLETGFIWTFCGGATRGYVETGDVERFLTGHLPLTIGEPDFLRWNWL